MSKLILSIITLLMTSMAWALTVDCNSSAYSYNNTVKQACTQTQQNIQQAKKNFQNAYSQTLANEQEKIAKAKAATSSTIPPTNTNNNANSNTSNNSTTTTDSTTTNNTAPSSSTSNPTTTPTTTSSPSSNGVNYY